MSLRSTISTPDGKRAYVRRLFATVADRYDFVTRFLSYGQDQRWKQRLIRLAAISASDCVLDLACGTGDLTSAAAPSAKLAVGVDVTHRMLQLARRRSASGAVAPARYVAGDMLALPFANERFDVITVGYGLRNVADLPAALREIHRMLAPGGRFLSLDFNCPANPAVRAVYLAYLTVIGSVLGLALHRDADTYRYIPESIRLYQEGAGVRRMLEEAGLRDVQAAPVLGGLLVIHRARKPALGSIARATATTRPGRKPGRPPR